MNLGLAALPEVSNPDTFSEFNRIYNAINKLATVLDQYTVDGDITTSFNALVLVVNAMESDVTRMLNMRAELAKTNKLLKALTESVDSIPNTIPRVVQLRKDLQIQQALGAAAIDLPTVIVLANNLRTMSINTKLGV